MSREIKFKDIKLTELLNKRNEIVLQGRKDDAVRQEMEEKLKKSGLELQKIDGKAGEILKKKNIELTIDLENKTFEQIVGAEAKGGEIIVKIEDRVEAFIEALKKQKKEIDEKKDEKPETPQK